MSRFTPAASSAQAAAPQPPVGARAQSASSPGMAPPAPAPGPRAQAGSPLAAPLQPPVPPPNRSAASSSAFTPLPGPHSSEAQSSLPVLRRNSVDNASGSMAAADAPRSQAAAPTPAAVRAALQQNVFSHVTAFPNVIPATFDPTPEGERAKIMEAGLLSQLGGVAGAGSMLPNSKFKENMIKTSSGLVHLGSTDLRYDANSPRTFYEQHYRNNHRQSLTLSVAPSREIRESLRDDPRDTAGGRLITERSIPASSILTVPLSDAIRPATGPGSIGADYAPAGFIRNALGDLGAGRHPTDQVEDIRRALHPDQPNIYPDPHGQ
jgi:hypothetical protein